MVYEQPPEVATDISCKADDPPTNPEVLVDVQNGSEWARIPVVKSNIWVNKDGPADITRTGKVLFPAEWGGVDVTNVVDAFSVPEEDDVETIKYDKCRIWHYDRQDDVWQIAHYGYLGAMGPAEQEGVLKLWCYDPADLLRGINVGQTFTNPSAGRVLRFVLNGTDNRGIDVGVNERSIFESIIPYVLTPERLRRQKTIGDFSPEETVGPFILDLREVAEYRSGGPTAETPPGVGNLVETIFDVTGFVPGGIGDPVQSQKTFHANRHNMVDVMNWLMDKVGGKWHFEPTPRGPVLLLDTAFGQEQVSYNVSHRHYVEEEVIEEEREDEALFNVPAKPTFAAVTTLENNALVDIKPINTLEYRGASTTNPNYDADLGDDVVTVTPEQGTDTPELEQPNFDAASTAPEGSVYPYVKVTNEELLARADGFEYGPAPVNGDATDLSTAVDEATKRYSEHLEEGSEGEMTLYGEPHALPYDFVTSITACQGVFPNVNAAPITYEINSVKHVRTNDEPYQTELDVSLVFDESTLDINASYQRA